MKEMAFLATFSLIALAAPSVVAAEEKATTEANTPDPNEMVCVVEKATGSRLAKAKVCRTRAEMEAQRAETRRQVERNQNSRQTHGN